MAEKSTKKRDFIIERSYAVFAKRGYTAVTMQDIVSACEISRGGLYLYFTSIEEIFTAVIAADIAGRGESGEALPASASTSDILALFMKEQKKEILRKKKSLLFAIYEYYFSLHITQVKLSAKDNFLKKQFETAVLILENLIRDGVLAGEFFCDDPRSTATNIMYTIEGLKITARTSGISEAAVDKQLIYIMQGLIIE